MDNTPLFDRNGKLLDGAALSAFADTLEPDRRQLFDDLVAAAHESEADDATAEACNSALHAAVRARDAAIAAVPKYSQHVLWLADVKHVPMKSDGGAFEAARAAESRLDQARLTARAAADAVRASRTRTATALSAWTAGGPKFTPEMQGATPPTRARNYRASFDHDDTHSRSHKGPTRQSKRRQ
jgi:hypothetical protein